MDIMKLLGFIFYAIGIIGGVEGMSKGDGMISIIAIIVIIAGSLLIVLSDENKK
jgi:hypothetical protein